MNKKTVSTVKPVLLVHLESLVLLVLLVFLCNTPSLAQEAHYRYADATQLWRLTDNAAGLSLDSAGNRGIAYFDLQHREGDYHRVQEGGQCNQLEFYTERYQRINPILVAYGSFRFDMDRTKDRSWCDVMRPYNSNPYYSGSSVAGKYDTQQFDLSAAVSTYAQDWAGLHRLLPLTKQRNFHRRSAFAVRAARRALLRTSRMLDSRESPPVRSFTLARRYGVVSFP